LAGLCGLAAPPTLQGKNIMPYILDSTPKPETYAFSQFAKNGQMGYSIFSESYRYTAWLDNPDGYTGEINPAPAYGEVEMEEFYDFEYDPNEMNNLADKPVFVSEKAKLKKALDDFIQHKSAKIPEGL
jgi:arylsulfatase A-like enzyme